MKFFAFIFSLVIASTCWSKPYSFVVRCARGTTCVSKKILPGAKVQQFLNKSLYIVESKNIHLCKKIKHADLCLRDKKVKFYPADEIKTADTATIEQDLPPPSCKMTPGMKNSDFVISPGQALTGIDLIRAESSDVKPRAVHIAIIDALIDPACISSEFNPVPNQCHQTDLPHGTSVSNILLAKGNGAFALSQGKGRVDLRDFLTLQQDLSTKTFVGTANQNRVQVELSTTLAMVEEFRRSPVGVVNFSGYMGLTSEDLENPTPQDLTDMKKINDLIFEEFHSLAREKTLVVSAGNNDVFMPEIENFVSSDMFVAGALDTGRQSENVHADKITAYVPQGNFGASGTFNLKGYGTFQTSSTAPVLSGAIANVKALVPQISNADLKLLIAKTGLPTKYGAPMLNAYKMYRVAREVAKRCLPESPVACVTTALKDPTIYNFDNEAQRVLSSLKTLMAAQPSNQCLTATEFALARKAYLLQSNTFNRNYYESLAKYFPQLTYP